MTSTTNGGELVNAGCVTAVTESKNNGNGCVGDSSCQPPEPSIVVPTATCDPEKDECILLDETNCIRLAYPASSSSSSASLPPPVKVLKPADLARKLTSEFAGTMLLVMVVIGSGIMAQNLSDDVGVQLMMNSIATIGGLYGLIIVFGPLSGAHFNPCVSFVDVLYQDMEVKTFAMYSVCQILGGIMGGILADIQFAEPVVFSTKERYGYELWISEIIGTTTLILVIHGCVRTAQTSTVAGVVAMWVGGGYFFTNSTIFANPAVTIGRMFSDTFAGIEPRSAIVYIPFQIIGAVLGFILTKFLYPQELQPVSKIENQYRPACVLSINDVITKKAH